MPSKPVQIGLRLFPRQKDALDFFSQMLASYRPDQVVSDGDSDDLNQLLKRHVRYDEKVGVGIAGFCVMLSPQGSKCFAVVRTDGTREPFTYKYCVTGLW